MLPTWADYQGVTTKKVTDPKKGVCKPVILDNQAVNPIWSKKVTDPFLKCYRLGVNGYRGFKQKVTDLVFFDFREPQLFEKKRPLFLLL